MKTTIKTYIRALPAALSLLFFSACMNILEPPAVRGTDSPELEIGEGRGLVRVTTETGSARTAMPAAALDHYEYWFTKSGRPAVKITPLGGDIFELEAGQWTVTVKAFAEPGDTSLAAEGTSAAFTITIGADAGTIPVTIHPVVSEGTGNLNYTLTYPAGVTVNSFTLTLLTGTDPVNLLTGSTSSGTDPLTRTGSKTGVAAGYYLAAAALTKTANGIKTSRTEVVHIYRSMTTSLAWDIDGACFTAVPVFSSADSGPGTLRDAITNAAAGNTIFIDLPEEDRVITLDSRLEITKTLTIEGNGAVLTRSAAFTTVNDSSQLLRISGSGLTARISRLHFKDGRAASYGAAIRQDSGTLYLESCILSGNQTSASNAIGGAVYNSGTLYVSGCTFYNNTSGYRGGAVYHNSGTLTLTGNIFYGNTAPECNVVYRSSGTVSSGGCNVSDKADGTDNTAGSGWTFITGDVQTSLLPIGPLTFKPLQGSAALNRISAVPAAYPPVDFYGVPIPASNAAAGAVQTAAAGYYLDYGALGPGTVNITSPTPNADSAYSGQVTLEAVPDTGYGFRYWTIDGTVQPDQSPATRLTLDMDTSKTVRAQFGRDITVTTTADSGAGSLREALTNIQDWDRIILPANGTIALDSALPDVTGTGNLTIDGNGAVLTRSSGFTASGVSQLLWIRGGSGFTVRVSRLHFKDGRAASLGAAVRNDNGTLYLESCIFSGNQTSASDAYGGAIYKEFGYLYISGCTFYNNTSGYRGGAVYNYSGALILTGNIFYGNTASNGGNVIYRNNGTVNSGGYNVSDKADGTDNTAGSGWAFAAGDVQTSLLPIGGISFRPLQESAALNRISAVPAAYPQVDFYGVPIPASGAAAGAVQTAVTGYSLDYGPLGPGTVNVLSGSVDADGFYMGPVTLEAAPDSGYVFQFWTIDGTRQPDQSPANQLTLDIDAHKTVRAQFCRDITVTTTADSGAGSLREALTGAQNWDRIILPANGTIALDSALPQITTNLTIEGNGVVLTRSAAFTTVSITSQLLWITGSARVSRLHFKDGRATDAGAAIRNNGTLYLESCIFSGNQTSASNAVGGAIYSHGPLYISGCTFYNNTSGYQGGAVYHDFGTSTLTGNIFYGNTAPQGNAVYGGVSSGGYNVSDYGGWTFAAGDVQTSLLPISGMAFMPLQGSAALNRISAVPAGYPITDFYGAAIPASGAAAGAVQTATAEYYLDYGPLGPGTVNVISGSIDTEGFYTGPVTLEATPDSGCVFRYWIVDGAVQPDQSPANQLIMDTSKTVRARFGRDITVTTTADSGAGSLREALTNIHQDGDNRIILPAGGTIALDSALPAVTGTGNLTIEGNGAVLTRTSSFTASSSSQLLRITSPGTVRISRLHFKDGRTTYNYGAAIYHSSGTGTLYLESCIFSGNQTSVSYAYGGAVYNGGTLHVSGCTFYNNTSGGKGGAVYHGSGTLTLTGNIFYGNTAPEGNVVSGGTVISGGYNVSDKADGTDNTAGSGWTFAAGDVQTNLPPISPLTFKPSLGSAALNRISAVPAAYPPVDFYGVPIPAFNAAAGAVQTAGTGYYLDYGALGPGTVNVLSGSADAEGFRTGSVTLEAAPDSDCVLRYWIVDGAVQPDQSPATRLTFTMDASKTVRAQFSRDFTVTTTADSGAGSLREALTGAQNWERIILPAGGTIVLDSALPAVTGTGNLTIEGNGAVLTRSSSFTVSDSSRLLRITSPGTVRINRLHFKDGRNGGYGGAVYHYSSGVLYLESCIFSGNQTSGGGGNGGAIFSHFNGTLNISGCTFYNNTSSFSGGAIEIVGGTLTLTGNIFYGNSAPNRNVASGVLYNYSGGTVISGGYNISDKASGTDNTAGSGWDFAATDKQVTSLTFNTTTFRPLSGNMNSGANGIQIVPANTPGFPATDFYGVARTFPGATGAIAFP